MSLLVSLKNINISFHKKIILNNIFLNLKLGKIITLIGPNGAGKSTLVRIVLGLIKPTNGKIFYLPNLRIGYVPQKFSINDALPITVYKFIKNLTPRIKFINILSILKRVKAEFLINSSLHTLSPGEIQRVLLARSLLNNPQLLVLDEPTQGIDINGQIDFYSLINKLKSELNCGIFMVSHNLHLVMAKTDEVLCLNKNHICCSGTPEMVLKHPEFTSMFAIYHHNHF